MISYRKRKVYIGQAFEAQRSMTVARGKPTVVSPTGRTSDRYFARIREFALRRSAPMQHGVRSNITEHAYTIHVVTDEFLTSGPHNRLNPQ